MKCSECGGELIQEDLPGDVCIPCETGIVEFDDSDMNSLDVLESAVREILSDLTSDLKKEN